MTEFMREIADRLEAARRSMDEARADGDDYLIQVRTGEIESLQRLIAEHGAPDVIELPADPPVVVGQPAERTTS